MRTGLARESREKNRSGIQGFTIVEMMVTMGVFSLITVAMVYAHLFGLRQDQLIQSKLGASDQSRRGFEMITRDIRTAKIYTVGNYASGTFTELPINASQQGNALQLCLTTNRSITITYYFDTNTVGNWKLCRLRTGDATPLVIASHLTNNFGNSLTFMAEDHRGNIITDISNRRAIHFILPFKQYQYPLTKVGQDCLYDFYKMEFRVTPHVPEGR